MKTTRSKIVTILQGQAGVYRIASELMFRGHHVCFPAADLHGVDLLLESGVKIQVKTANLGFYERTPQGAYWFNFGQSKYSDELKKLIKVKRDYSTQCDFVILFGIDDSKFWVVPAAILNGANGVVMGRAEQYKNLNPDVIQELQEQGHTQEEIGRLLDVDQSTISRRNSGKYISPKRTLTIQVRLCENAWHLIHELELQRQPQGKLIEMPKVESVAS